MFVLHGTVLTCRNPDCIVSKSGAGVHQRQLKHRPRWETGEDREPGLLAPSLFAVQSMVCSRQKVSGQWGLSVARQVECALEREGVSLVEASSRWSGREFFQSFEVHVCVELWNCGMDGSLSRSQSKMVVRIVVLVLWCMGWWSKQAKCTSGRGEVEISTSGSVSDEC